MENSDEKNIAVYQEILNGLTRHLKTDLNKISEGSLSLSLPHIPKESVKLLCDECQKLFMKDQTLMHINPPCIIIGDIHGHFLDLLRILKVFGLPINRRFVFLGDLVDRGEFSIETVLLVFALKAIYPENVYLIRGNHEFDSLCAKCGFFLEVKCIYNDNDVYDSFLNVFNILPMGALIKDNILCLHGGIGPSNKTLSEISELPRPALDFTDDIMNEILWSDPVEDIEGFEISSRGIGYLYGTNVIKDFLNFNNLSLLVRGHECVMDGFQYNCDNRVVTVFSASNYCGLVRNESAVLIMNAAGDITFKTFPPFNYIKRSSCIVTSNILPKNSRSIGSILEPLSSINNVGYKVPRKPIYASSAKVLQTRPVIPRLKTLSAKK